MLNKYIQAFLDDNNLKANEVFKIDGYDNEYYFDDDGYLRFKDILCSRYSDLLTSVLNDNERIIKITPIPTERFIPKKGERYYFLNTVGKISHLTNSKDDFDTYVIHHNLVFKTKEQAEDYKWFLDKVDEYKKPFKYEDYNNFLYYDHYYESIEMLTVTTAEYQGTIHFGDKANTKAFIEEVGEERIKKYMFDVWE